MNIAIDQGKGYPWEVSGSVCKDDRNGSCHLNLIYMLLCQSSCGAVESILIPAESGLALWLTLTNGRQQGWRVWLLSLGLMRFYRACFHLLELCLETATEGIWPVLLAVRDVVQSVGHRRWQRTPAASHASRHHEPSTELLAVVSPAAGCADESMHAQLWPQPLLAPLFCSVKWR